MEQPSTNTRRKRIGEERGREERKGKDMITGGKCKLHREAIMFDSSLFPRKCESETLLWAEKNEPKHGRG